MNKIYYILYTELYIEYMLYKGYIFIYRIKYYSVMIKSEILLSETK